jgi:hypothetical protein
MARLIIHRRRAWADALRAYRIRVDGVDRGEVRQGGTIELQVDPGGRTVRLMVDWCSSPDLFVRAGDAPVNLACWSWGVWHPFRAFLAPNKYIRLVEVGG